MIKEKKNRKDTAWNFQIPESFESWAWVSTERLCQSGLKRYDGPFDGGPEVCYSFIYIIESGDYT